MVEMDVKITSADLYDYMMKHTYSGSSGIIGTTIGALGIVVGVSMDYVRLTIRGVIVIFYLPVTLFIKSKQQIAMTPAFKNPLHYTLDEEGLTVSQGEQSQTIAWENCFKAISTPKSIIVYTSRINATIFPKNQMEDKKNAVIEMTSTHMDPSKVQIKE